MLLNLSIKNYALIEDLNLDFSDGFTVISGETGAGKSIIINSIELLTGSRADISSIRSGCSVCTIGGTFEFKNSKISDFLNNLSIEAPDSTVLIRRVIENTGKSKAYINDFPVNVSTLSKLGGLLIDFHSQDEKHSLLDSQTQLLILDARTPETAPLLEKSAALYGQVKDLKAKLEAINLSDADRERKLDLYSFQLQEINDANLEQGEEEKLEAELPKLKNAEKIANLSNEAISLLHSGDSDALNAILKAKKNIETINSLGADASEALSLIEQSYYQAEEAYREIENILSKTDLNPEKLNAALERAELIKKLKKKYGTAIADILSYRDSIETELKNISGFKENTEKLEKELAAKTGELTDICEKISLARKKSATVFCANVQKNLTELEIKNALFEISFMQKEPAADGYDSIEFMFCANKGEKILPLRACASGGELSRVLLAIETSSGLQSDQTTIFDEIDTGTGGKTGEKIGEKLKELSKNKQLFAITHLAQVAAFAKTHIKIYKETENERTYTKARILSENEHIEEIARMISGEKITPAAIEHAKQLINKN
ncbi:DNA repair protein RecN [Endomicrobium proavitum]|uniref:DNA repair protein RecN n=1 Tax=Endomicrobium proavitum TaxID=1408281 RepID=A0A0G3WIV8_9BACT|nr:DNA repair protein RecN [Endomicrobium proavitum]AKL97429.1 DNA repair protein RecN [Endomicrobium proavitum]